MKRFARQTLILLCAAALGLPASIGAQEQSPATQPATNQQATEEKSRALQFLEGLEDKYSNTKSLRAEFDQLRIDHGLMNEVESSGRFWYRAPDQFHAVYESGESNEKIWMRDGELITYVPELEQVEIIPQEQGEDAPMNQLLLGFGLKTEKIQDLFEVSISEKETPKDQIAIAFKSRDLNRSMGYETITIFFSREEKQPKRIILEDPQSTTTVNLRKVQVNPKIKDSVFETKWPDDADVLRY